MKTIKILPKKKTGFTFGARNPHLKVTRWSCDLQLTKLDGSTYLVQVPYESERLKRDIVVKANEYKAYILSKGDFYF